MKEITREECEKLILDKMEEVVDIYHRYNPDGEYLNACFVKKGMSVIWATNEYYDGGADEHSPINCTREREYGSDNAYQE